MVFDEVMVETVPKSYGRTRHKPARAELLFLNNNMENRTNGVYEANITRLR